MPQAPKTTRLRSEQSGILDAGHPTYSRSRRPHTPTPGVSDVRNVEPQPRPAPADRTAFAELGAVRAIVGLRHQASETRIVPGLRIIAISAAVSSDAIRSDNRPANSS